MSSTLVQYQGVPAALVNARRLSFLGDVRHLPPGHPIVRVVTHMAFYAQLVLLGEMPGPYYDEDAERFARFALIDPDELVERAAEDDTALAARFRVPIQEVARSRQEVRGADGR